MDEQITTSELLTLLSTTCGGRSPKSAECGNAIPEAKMARMVLLLPGMVFVGCSGLKQPRSDRRVARILAGLVRK
jgi:hypothetical protein